MRKETMKKKILRVLLGVGLALSILTAAALAENSVTSTEEGAEVIFSVVESGDITVRIVDSGGKTVATLHEGKLPAGTHTTEWKTGNQTVTGGYTVEVLRTGSPPIKRGE